jgi:hypothetical protein
MSNLELKFNHFTTNKPIIWIRYVDDVFCIFNNKQNIEDFLRRINNWHICYMRVINVEILGVLQSDWSIIR